MADARTRGTMTHTVGLVTGDLKEMLGLFCPEHMVFIDMFLNGKGVSITFVYVTGHIIYYLQVDLLG